MKFSKKTWAESPVMLLYNNQRKLNGLPTLRKRNKRRRRETRCEAMETIGAFLDYCNGKEVVRR